MPTNILSAETILSSQFVYEFLVDAADSPDMDTSVDTVYSYTVPSGKYLRLMRCNAVLTDTNMDTSDFGGISALTTGCSFGVYDAADNVLCDFTGGQNLKTNSDWSFLAGIDSIPYTTKGTDDFFPIRFTVAKATGRPMRIRAGESIRLTVNDNTSAIERFRIMIQGSLHNYTPSRMSIA
jgi:hypothetical protein